MVESHFSLSSSSSSFFSKRRSDIEEGGGEGGEVIFDREGGEGHFSFITIRERTKRRRRSDLRPYKKREALLLYSYEEEEYEEKSPSTINEGTVTSSS